MKTYYKLKNALKIGIWAFRNPLCLQLGNFEMLSKLFEMILKVSMEQRPLMTHIGYVHPEEGNKEIVSIWAGAGMGASPTKRIAELLAENNLLKAALNKNILDQSETN